MRIRRHAYGGIANSVWVAKDAGGWTGDSTGELAAARGCEEVARLHWIACETRERARVTANRDAGRLSAQFRAT